MAKRIRLISFFVSTLFFSITVAAQIYQGADLKQTSVANLVASLQPGSVLVIGEVHDSEIHHQHQVQLLKAIQERGLSIDVGMEFFSYPDQGVLDSYLRGDLDENTFLRRVQWGGLPFAYYREQVLMPRSFGGWTWALNIPRSVTGKVAKSGLDSLSDSEKEFLPPNFQMGNDSYFERFQDVMGGHVPKEKLLNYFAAQSLWDDTMAWQTGLRQGSSAADVFVIIVGEFHVAWTGGLPDRLRARGLQNVVTISQVQEAEEVALHPRYGVRADYIWLAK